MAFLTRKSFIGLAAAGAVALSMVPAKAEQFINVLTGGQSGVSGGSLGKGLRYEGS